MYDAIIGALLVASWINLILLTLEITQVISYYKQYQDDRIVLKALVGTCFGLDIISTVASEIGVYRYTITNWGNVQFMNEQQWHYPVYLYATGLGAALVQTYLAWRYYTLSKHRIPVILLLLLMLASLAGVLCTATLLTYATKISERERVRIPVAIWLVGSCIVDCSLAGLLVFYLQTAHVVSKSTRSLIKRLTSVAIQSGTCTSVVALIVLGFAMGNIGGNISTGVCQCLGRIYTLTLLYNLLIRKSAREDAIRYNFQTVDTDSIPLSSGMTFRTNQVVTVGKQGQKSEPNTSAQTGKPTVEVFGGDERSKAYPLA